jgi:DNA/RNA endonuclease YhcR with UshA esterase domain
MRMQKEEKIVVVLLLMAMGSLAIAFWTFSPEEGTGDSVAVKEAASLYVEGLVLDMKPTSTGGNLLLRLDSTPLSVFVPAGSGAGEVQKKVRAGDRVRIRGTVSVFQGTEEIKVERATDVELVN